MRNSTQIPTSTGVKNVMVGGSIEKSALSIELIGQRQLHQFVSKHTSTTRKRVAPSGLNDVCASLARVNVVFGVRKLISAASVEYHSLARRACMLANLALSS